MQTLRRFNVMGLLALGAMTAAGVVWAAQTASTASVTVVRPIAVSRTAVLSFGKAVPAGPDAVGYVIVPAAPPSARQTQNATLQPGADSSPLILSVSGEPNRAYRITVPASAISSPGSFAVAGFSIWTQTSGDITSSKLAHFSASGVDTVRVGARIAIPRGTKAQAYTAQVPVSIAYE